MSRQIKGHILVRRFVLYFLSCFLNPVSAVTFPSSVFLTPGLLFPATPPKTFPLISPFFTILSLVQMNSKLHAVKYMCLTSSSSNISVFTGPNTKKCDIIFFKKEKMHVNLPDEL
ncbi:hypothetical protein XENORESO_006096 [Xenotaenia resolanae]|uniref:Uncharacterized protein n=1 Tax=Xenotaenia resolanae TaxID=208358 RepID=A0ABV0WM74_9TELE